MRKSPSEGKFRFDKQTFRKHPTIKYSRLRDMTKLRKLLETDLKNLILNQDVKGARNCHNRLCKACTFLEELGK